MWDTDTNGNYLGSPTGVVTATDAGLENLETSFGSDLNGDGTIGLKSTTIEAAGANSLLLVGNQYLMQNGASPAVILKLSGSPVTVGQFGATIAPIAAAAITGGYEVAWKVGTSGPYIVWDTDTNGNYLGSPTGVVNGQAFALEDLEPSFGFDVNGDGRLSTQLITSGSSVNLNGQSTAATVNLSGDTASASGGLSAPSLTFIGGTPDAVTLGSGASIVEYALQPASGIETVAGFVLGTDLLNIDLVGAANSVLKMFDTKVNGNGAVAISSSADPLHGIVLLSTSGFNASTLLSAHTTFVGGHALVS